jgi:hypothetical protein
MTGVQPPNNILDWPLQDGETAFASRRTSSAQNLPDRFVREESPYRGHRPQEWADYDVSGRGSGISRQRSVLIAS